MWTEITRPKYERTATTALERIGILPCNVREILLRWRFAARRFSNQVR